MRMSRAIRKIRASSWRWRSSPSSPARSRSSASIRRRHSARGWARPLVVEPPMWRTSIWVLGGALAPLVYLIAVVLGGVLTRGYSPLAGPVSALIMTGAPAAAVLIPLFALYNALLMAFAFTTREALRDRGVHVSLIGPIALAVVALAGVLMLLYPMDPLGIPLTESGRLHVWFAGLAAFFSMV